MKIVETLIEETILPRKDKDWKFALAASPATQGWVYCESRDWRHRSRSRLPRCSEPISPRQVCPNTTLCRPRARPE